MLGWRKVFLSVKLTGIWCGESRREGLVLVQTGCSVGVVAKMRIC